MRILQLSGNTLRCCDSGQSARLSCKHSPLFLRLLFTCSRNNQTLTTKALEIAIQREQPAFTLHRNQVLRLLNDMENALSTLATRVHIEPVKYRRSTGPWSLSGADAVFLSDEGQAEAPATIPIEKSRYFDWGDNWRSIPQRLHDFLSVFLQADMLAHAGYAKDALPYLSQCEEFALKPRMKAFIRLKYAAYLIQLGDFVAAKRLIRDVANAPQPQDDKTIISTIQYLLARIDYNQNPAKNYAVLLSAVDKPPAFNHADEVSLMQWHNLRALLLKRHAKATPEQAEISHRQALYHFEECLFIAIRTSNIDATIDYMLNLALHLQELLPLQLSTLTDICHWYHLATNYSDKIGSGDYAIWDRIFFTEFYLAHRDELVTSADAQSILQMDLSPNKPDFYRETLERIDSSSDMRQKIIFLILYIRFARLQDNPRLIFNLSFQTARLLRKQDTSLVNALRKEGYRWDIDKILYSQPV